MSVRFTRGGLVHRQVASDSCVTGLFVRQHRAVAGSLVMYRLAGPRLAAMTA